MQTKVFNVEIPNVFTPSEALSYVLKTVKKCTQYKVEAGHGFRECGGRAICQLELLVVVSNFKFYKYKNKKAIVEVKTKLASFYDKPFSCSYAKHIGATFFDDINRRMIKYTRDALKDILPFYCCLYKAKSGNYYCWKHISIEHAENGWNLYEITEKEVIEKIQVVEK